MENPNACMKMACILIQDDDDLSYKEKICLTLQTASDNGDIHITFYYGDLLLTDDGVLYDRQFGAEFVIKASESGFGRSPSKVRIRLNKGIKLPQDETKAAQPRRCSLYV
ncbi:hypothetical protein M9Y10_025143 [Tritrichomonas musculus]|uniref:Uncharacterized protein n=1 Tax=Tritrichomonas musculus TaxID=1915356 RepID=A0ABR2HBV8_9EUKA